MSERLRKHVRLKDYDYATDGAYFVTICTSKRLPLIKGEYQSIIQQGLKNLEKRFKGVKLDYHVIMPDHLHLIFIFENSSTSLPQLIQAFKSITTLQLKRQGYSFKRFWQPNYFEHVIRNEKSLNKIREYIINNPLIEEIKWGNLDKM